MPARAHRAISFGWGEWTVSDVFDSRDFTHGGFGVATSADVCSPTGTDGIRDASIRC
ncbi:MAG: hypothetical protein ABL974_21520 [Prosthecobacter sp.]